MFYILSALDRVYWRLFPMRNLNESWLLVLRVLLDSLQVHAFCCVMEINPKSVPAVTWHWFHFDFQQGQRCKAWQNSLILRSTFVKWYRLWIKCYFLLCKVNFTKQNYIFTNVFEVTSRHCTWLLNFFLFLLLIEVGIFSLCVCCSTYTAALIP